MDAMEHRPCFKLLGIPIFPVNVQLPEVNPPAEKQEGKEKPLIIQEENIPEKQPFLGPLFDAAVAVTLFLPVEIQPQESNSASSKEEEKPQIIEEEKRPKKQVSLDPLFGGDDAALTLFLPVETQPPESSSAAEKREGEKALIIREEKIPKNQPFLDPLFRDALLSAGASADDADLILIFAKRLYDSDVNKGLARLTMPRSSIVNQFLTEEEELRLKQKDDKDKPLKIPVKVIDPSLRVHDLNLARWNYNNSGPKSEKSKPIKKRKMETKSEPSWSYALSGGWRNLAESNQLRGGSKIQVWAFRRVNGELGLVIVNPEMEFAADVVVDHDAGRDLAWGKRKRRGGRR